MKKRDVPSWVKTVLEVLKWGLVLWLIWPLRRLSGGSVSIERILLGILLFIVFAGKVLYDTVIMSIIRQRRDSTKQDIITLIGIVLGMGLVVGLVIVLVGFLVVALFQASQQPAE